jgi:hypothetical protein
VRALERLVAWKLSLHGLPTHGRVPVVVSPGGSFYSAFGAGAHVSLPRVAGHRDGDSTSCPGDVLYGELPAIRPRITALAGTPARLRIGGVPSGVVVAPAVVAVGGSLGVLGGGPIAGAPIELQQVGPGGAATVASATTAVDGSWSAQLSLSYSAALRALHRPAPAAVSAVAEVAVAPAVTLTVVPGSPVQVSGTVAPPKSHVMIVVRRRGRVIKRKRVPVVAGRYVSAIWVARAGDVVRAVTVADGLNAGGGSVAVAVPG